MQPDVPARTSCTVQLIKCCSWWWTNDSPKNVQPFNEKIDYSCASRCFIYTLQYDARYIQRQIESFALWFGLITFQVPSITKTNMKQTACLIILDLMSQSGPLISDVIKLLNWRQSFFFCSRWGRRNQSAGMTPRSTREQIYTLTTHPFCVQAIWYSQTAVSFPSNSVTAYIIFQVPPPPFPGKQNIN